MKPGPEIIRTTKLATFRSRTASLESGQGGRERRDQCGNQTNERTEAPANTTETNAARLEQEGNHGEHGVNASREQQQLRLGSGNL